MNSLGLLALVGQSAAGGLTAWQLVLQAGLMVKFVLFVLAALSVLCWATIAFKYAQLRKARAEGKLFLKAFWAGESLDKVAASTRRLSATPLAEVFRAGLAELEQVRKGRKRDEETIADLSRADMGIENVERALHQAATTELNRLTRFLSFLATTGSTAPFIGLFGTVWGIMNSFQRIGAMKGAGFEVVGAGISEALIATAAGLAAAIPAVVAYNYFLSGIKAIQSEMDNFQAEFINIIERHYLSKRLGRKPDSN